MVKKFKLEPKDKFQNFSDNLEIFKNQTDSYFNSEKIFQKLNPLNQAEDYWNKNILLGDEIERRSELSDEERKNERKRVDYLEKRRYEYIGRKRYYGASCPRRPEKKLRLFSKKCKKVFNKMSQKIGKSRKKLDLDNIKYLIKSVRKLPDRATSPYQNDMLGASLSPLKNQKLSSNLFLSQIPKNNRMNKLLIKVDEPNEIIENINYVSSITSRVNSRKKNLGPILIKDEAKNRLHKFFMHESMKNNDKKIRELKSIEREYKKMKKKMLRKVEYKSKKFSVLKKVNYYFC